MLFFFWTTLLRGLAVMEIVIELEGWVGLVWVLE